MLQAVEYKESQNAAFYIFHVKNNGNVANNKVYVPGSRVQRKSEY